MAQERYSDPYDPDGEHQHVGRVRDAFGRLHSELGEKITKEDEERMLGIREAVESRDRDRAEKHLGSVKQESSWLYEELMKHPEISSIMRELSIMGF